MYIETTSGAQFSSSQAITATADSTNIFDVTGAGVGNAPAMIGAGGLNTAMGYDVGGAIGNAQPTILFTVVSTTTVTGVLAVSIKAAPDSGSYTEGTYTTIFTSGGLTGATQLAAGKQYLFPVPIITPGEALPRFYKLTYTVVSGSISIVGSAALLFNGAMVRDATLYGNNFVAL